MRPYVQIGRLCLIAKGDDANKLVTIVDVIDQNQVIVCGPTTGVSRKALPIKQLTLTRFVAKIPRGVRASLLAKMLEEQKVIEQFNATQFGKKVANREIRANLTDFDRFKVRALKQKRAALMKQ